MKKTLLKTLICSIIITIGCAFLNIIWANNYGKLLFCKTYYGGEITEQVGFGIVFSELYPLTIEGENVRSSDNMLNISVKNLLLSFVITFVITFIIILLIDFLKKKVSINKK